MFGLFSASICEISLFSASDLDKCFSLFFFLKFFSRSFQRFFQRNRTLLISFKIYALFQSNRLLFEMKCDVYVFCCVIWEGGCFCWMDEQFLVCETPTQCYCSFGKLELLRPWEKVIIDRHNMLTLTNSHDTHTHTQH
jgi:hypothetical protein